MCARERWRCGKSTAIPQRRRRRRRKRSPGQTTTAVQGKTNTANHTHLSYPQSRTDTSMFCMQIETHRHICAFNLLSSQWLLQRLFRLDSRCRDQPWTTQEKCKGKKEKQRLRRGWGEEEGREEGAKERESRQRRRVTKEEAAKGEEEGLSSVTLIPHYCHCDSQLLLCAFKYDKSFFCNIFCTFEKLHKWQFLISSAYKLRWKLIELPAKCSRLCKSWLRKQMLHHAKP